MGKPDQIGVILVISGMLKLFRHYALRMGTDRAFHKDGQDIEKTLDPVLFFIRRTTKNVTVDPCTERVNISIRRRPITYLFK